MGSQRIRTGLLVSALAAALALLLLVFQPGFAPLRRAILALRSRPHAAQAGSSAAPSSAPAAGAEERSRLADDLNSPSGDVHADLRLINEIFIAYRGAVRSGNPVGENSEITAALKGRNKLSFAFIPPDNPAINPKGELCDRWGTPYFFHQLSGEKMEIRSAGPDHRLWTADDEVLTP
jgi:hypothetical protein